MASKKKVVTPKKAMVQKTKKVRAPQLVTSGRMYVKATFNNTLITFTDAGGNVISWTNTGNVGFKGARKSTPYAATTTIEESVKKVKERGLSAVDVFIKGPGPGRDAVLRVLRNSGLDINMIADLTPVPHNGCRPKKPRRV